VRRGRREAIHGSSLYGLRCEFLVAAKLESLLHSVERFGPAEFVEVADFGGGESAVRQDDFGLWAAVEKFDGDEGLADVIATGSLSTFPLPIPRVDQSFRNADFVVLAVNMVDITV
jgi:hypothetical protein